VVRLSEPETLCQFAVMLEIFDFQVSSWKTWKLARGSLVSQRTTGYEIEIADPILLSHSTLETGPFELSV
jgi:hypothetical protein